MKARSFYYFSWEKSLCSLREKLLPVGNRTLGSIFRIYEALPRQMERESHPKQLQLWETALILHAGFHIHNYA